MRNFAPYPNNKLKLFPIAESLSKKFMGSFTPICKIELDKKNARLNWTKKMQDWTGCFFLYSDCFFHMKNYHFALADYQQALDLDSDDWDIKSRISRQYSERNFGEIKQLFFKELRLKFILD